MRITALILAALLVAGCAPAQSKTQAYIGEVRQQSVVAVRSLATAQQAVETIARLAAPTGPLTTAATEDRKVSTAAVSDLAALKANKWVQTALTLQTLTRVLEMLGIGYVVLSFVAPILGARGILPGIMGTIVSHNVGTPFFRWFGGLFARGAK